jgi:membrane protein DedA with SNARE-associated domain
VTPLPFPFPFLETATGPFLFVALAVATFVSEDLTCLAAGLLVAAGRSDWFPAVAACFVGIALGDAGVWLIGRSAGGRGWVKRLLPEPQRTELTNWFARHGGKVAFASRFLPGTRVPLLLAAGIAKRGGARVLFWAFVAALVWVPLVVLSVAAFGAALPGWVVLATAVGLFVALRTVPELFTHVGRSKLHARVSKLWRWEFWPAWVFYLPLAPWFLYLAARYRSFTVWTAANPGIPAGGVVGESKSDILAKLPPEWIIPTLLVPAGEHAERVRLVRRSVSVRGWSFPLVLKPDVGERGAGVQKAHDETDVEKYLLAHPHAVIVQPYHAGPFEVGVFYCRIPGEDRGCIFSVTDKVFPVVTGDGRSTLEELIWAHPRFRMQAATFLARHAAVAGLVLAEGESLTLTMAGNHCQGTLFRDGGHLITPELEAAFDALARHFDGFFVGRFDVRYGNEEEFRAGRGFAVVELNGVMSESTNLYDPSWSLWRAYRTLFRQWALLFRIGAANRRRGHRPAGVPELLKLLWAYSRGRGNGGTRQHRSASNASAA